MTGGVCVPQRAIELILLRRWASYLRMAVFLVGPSGQMLYFNAAAAVLLGVEFDEAGDMPMEEWEAMFSMATRDGEPMPAPEMPLGVAALQRRPMHGPMRLVGLDGVTRDIEVSALPLNGQGGQYLGAIAFFWESSAE
jgi:PAS domain-containing protein